MSKHSDQIGLRPYTRVYLHYYVFFLVSLALRIIFPSLPPREKQEDIEGHYTALRARGELWGIAGEVRKKSWRRGLESEAPTEHSRTP